MYKGSARASKVAASWQERAENGCMGTAQVAEEGEEEEEEGERGKKAFVLPVGEAEPPVEGKKQHKTQ